MKSIAKLEDNTFNIEGVTEEEFATLMLAMSVYYADICRTLEKADNASFYNELSETQVKVLRILTQLYAVELAKEEPKS